MAKADLEPQPDPEPAAGTGSEDHGFTVRPAGRGDVDDFLEMWRRVVAEGIHVRSDAVRGTARQYRRMFRRGWTDDEVNLLAMSQGRVIGHLSATREQGASTRHLAFIGMAVAKEWRGRGVGSALMAEAIRWGRGVRIEKLALTVYPHNAAARALYRKFGFEEEGRLTGHSKKRVGYLDEIVMGLWLIPRPPSPEIPS